MGPAIARRILRLTCIADSLASKTRRLCDPSSVRSLQAYPPPTRLAARLEPRFWLVCRRSALSPRRVLAGYVIRSMRPGYRPPVYIGDPTKTGSAQAFASQQANLLCAKPPVTGSISGPCSNSNLALMFLYGNGYGTFRDLYFALQLTINTTRACFEHEGTSNVAHLSVLAA
jgi:hypothetical protein